MGFKKFLKGLTLDENSIKGKIHNYKKNIDNFNLGLDFFTENSELSILIFETDSLDNIDKQILFNKIKSNSDDLEFKNNIKKILLDEKKKLNEIYEKNFDQK